MKKKFSLTEPSKFLPRPTCNWFPSPCPRARDRDREREIEIEREREIEREKYIRKYTKRWINSKSQKLELTMIFLLEKQI